MRGFFVGRFQPFHRGHAKFVDEIADEVEDVVIGIGSAELSHTVENPFTTGERITMIHQAVAPVEPTTYVIPIPDVERNAIWVSHVTSLCPPFDRVYTNNPLVERLFGEADIEVRGMQLFERDRFRGTEIRRRMLDGEAWRDLLPGPVAAVVDEIDGVERLRTVAGNDVEAA